MSDNVELRALLFATLEGLKNQTIGLEQADAINKTAQSIINCAKVEVEYMKASGQTVSSGFVALVDGDKGATQTLNGQKITQQVDRKSTRLNSSHPQLSRMPSSA